MRSLLVIMMLGLAAGACASPEDAPPVRDTATQVIPSSQPSTPAQPQRPVIVGGYGASSTTDPGMAAAQKLAVDEIYKRDPQRGIVENVASETQVVAGLNYRFTIKMTGVNSYRVVVYSPLPGQGDMRVTSFEKLTGG